MKKPINLVIIEINYFGTMAGSQRIRNLVDGLLQIEPMKVSNIIVNSICEEDTNNNVEKIQLNYSLKNIFSVVRYFIQANRFLKKSFSEEYQNVLYCYGYPSIQNWLILQKARKLGYKICFDVVEKLTALDMSKASLKSKIKHKTSLYLLNKIPEVGNICFAISNTLMNFCNDVCKGEILVAFLPISVNEKKVISFKNTETTKEESIKVFYGGSFGLKDGIPLLIEGFSKAAEKNENIELLLTGKVSKQMKDQLPILINSSIVKDKIHYLGCLSSDDFYKTMVNTDILCMLRVDSDYANAGFPFKLGEYLASGNAVIATRTSDVEQYLVHDQNAFLINPNAVDEITDAILQLAQNRQRRERLGESGKLVVKSYFSMLDVSRVLFQNIQ